MAAQFKSNVRLREEKGFGSVSMKRLIFCGVGAVLAFMVLRLTPLANVSLPALAVIFIVLLILSGSRGGLPVWQRLLLGWRGTLVLLAMRHPNGLGAQAAAALNLDPGAAQLHSARLYSTQRPDTGIEPSDWTLYADLAEAEGQHGFRFISLGETDGE